MKWLIGISSKKGCSYIQANIKEFYSQINEDILINAIKTTIDDKDLRLIMHWRKSLVFFGNKTWKIKSAESCFDVNMGIFDGAEIGQLLGLYIH